MKTLKEITVPDERQTLFLGNLHDLHMELSTINLDINVPANVRELFETAKNVSLYSWFVYDFHPIAELAGFLALEAALRARASQESGTVAKKPLRFLMRHAVSAAWLSEERITDRREIARARVAQRKAMQAIEHSKASGRDSVPVEEPTETEISAEASEMRIIEGMSEAAINLRNSLAHGERMLVPGSHRRLRITADLINQLFVTP
ncbi:putative integron gene cassette protein [uncultured Woeseiaceae bacterium]|uniref:Putative integron gene cassette protein n=1 Tax=uncultured Woeseiaceae bacterium TaxID=1983305 RepID=A0A7D9D1I4_9GAMM|nr:putative integron gene cassette protein [uncultured Woeseiaceae bacterium]